MHAQCFERTQVAFMSAQWYLQYGCKPSRGEEKAITTERQRRKNAYYP